MCMHVCVVCALGVNMCVICAVCGTCVYVIWVGVFGIRCVSHMLVCVCMCMPECMSV